MVLLEALDHDAALALTSGFEREDPPHVQQRFALGHFSRYCTAHLVLEPRVDLLLLALLLLLPVLG